MNEQLKASLLVFINLAIQVAPQLLEVGRRIAKILNSDGDPTPEEQAELDALQEQVYQAVKAAGAAKLAE